MVGPAGLLQLGTDAPTGLLVALGVVALAVVLLALRGIVDWLFGPEAEEVTYRLVETDAGLVLADVDEAAGRRLVGLDDDAMLALLDEAERRNEIRIHAVLDREGARVDWEEWRRDAERQAPAGVILEDSKGIVEVHDSGRVKAKPPLDEAVRGDLLEVLGEVVGPPPLPDE